MKHKTASSSGSTHNSDTQQETDDGGRDSDGNEEVAGDVFLLGYGGLGLQGGCGGDIQGFNNFVYTSRGGSMIKGKRKEGKGKIV